MNKHFRIAIILFSALAFLGTTSSIADARRGRSSDDHLESGHRSSGHYSEYEHRSSGRHHRESESEHKSSGHHHSESESGHRSSTHHGETHNGGRKSGIVNLSIPTPYSKNQ